MSSSSSPSRFPSSSSSAESEPDPSDASIANKSSMVPSFCSIEAASLESGERGLSMRGGETAERECWWPAADLRWLSSDFRVGRLGVDLDCRPGGTLPLVEEVMVVVAIETHASIACFGLGLGERTEHAFALAGRRVLTLE
jgi:hypothetical protein